MGLRLGILFFNFLNFLCFIFTNVGYVPKSVSKDLAVIQVVETEASREALRKDLANLQRKMAELIDESRMKEKDYQLALEDSRRAERKLEDNRRNLEMVLENANAENGDLRVSINISLVFVSLVLEEKNKFALSLESNASIPSAQSKIDTAPIQRNMKLIFESGT